MLIARAVSAASGQVITDSCTVSVLNRTVTASPDGRWVLPNVPANFGPVRARVTCTVNGQTISGESDPFVIPANGVVNIPQIRFGQSTPIPTSLTAVAPGTPLTQQGATSQLIVTARYTDGSTKDVTGDGTTYTVSNAAIASVTGGGLVQAVSSGTVIIQASHEGASGMTTVQVALATTDTDGDGIPDAVELSLGLNPNNPVDAQEDFDRDGLTNLQEYQLGTDMRKADTDGDGLKDGDEVNTYNTSPLLADTDGDGVSDGLEVQSGSNPLDPTSVNLAGVLTGITVKPAAFTLTFNTVAGDVSQQLTVTGTLKDGKTLDLTARNGTNYSSSNLTICSFNPTPGRIFAGQSGSCVITVTVPGFTTTANGTVNTFAPTPLSSVALNGPGNGVDVAGNFVYVAAGGAGLQVVNVSNRNAPHVAATLSLLGTANDVKLSGSRAFVAAGAAGLHVIDIVNPLLPRLLGSVDTPGNALDVRVRGNLAFVADGAAGLQVIDISNPGSPRIVGNVATGPGANGVDVENTLAVVVTGTGGVRIIDVSNPTLPAVIGSLTTPGSALDVVVRSGFAYVADLTGSLRVVDFRSPTAPVLGGTLPGSLGGFLLDVALMDTFVFGADIFMVNSVPITDVSDPNNPRPRPRIDFPGDATGLGIAVDGSYVYLGTDTNRLYVGQYRVQQDLNGLPPTVSIAAPANGDTFVETEVIPVMVSASDDLAVAGVTLLVSGVPAGTSTSAPYQFNVTAPVGATSLTLGALANDLGNNVGTAADVTVNVIPDPLTTAVGRVVLQDGTTVTGATVTCLAQNGTTLSDGSFTVSGVSTTQPTVVCDASAVDGGVTKRGRSVPVRPVRGANTPIGDIILAPVPIITSITPNAIDSTRPPSSIQVTGANFAGSTFYFAPVLNPPLLTAGTPQINAAGTLATIPITVVSTARGRFTLVGTNSFGGVDVTPTPGNALTVFNAQDDGDTDADGYADGLELLFGSDPQNPASLPDFTRVGDVVSPPVSVSNTALPEGSQQNATSAAVSVSNTALPTGAQQNATSAAVSVSNTALPTGSQQNATSAAVSVSNTALPPGPQAIVSAAFSVFNDNTLTGAQALPQPTGAARTVLAVAIDQPGNGDLLVEGATIPLSAAVSGAPAGASVTFAVNGQPIVTDATAPYLIAFTVPAGIQSMSFSATVRTSEGVQAEAVPVKVDVEPDPLTTITGRVVDSNGNPVADALVDVLSVGLQAEFFKLNQQPSALPDLEGLTPERVGRTTSLAMWNPGGIFGADPFGARQTPHYAGRFTGWMNVTDAGRYTFFLAVHEGARLRINGMTVIDVPDGLAASTEGSGSIDLPQGLVPIEVTFFESRGNAELQLSFVAPGRERQIVPPGMLVPGWLPFVVKTDASGHFAIAGVPTALKSIQIRVSLADGGQTISVTSDAVTSLPTSGVNVGDIVIRRPPR